MYVVPMICFMYPLMYVHAPLGGMYVSFSEQYIYINSV